MTNYKLTVPPPTMIDRDFIKPLLCGSGPCDVRPSIAEALVKPVITPACDELYNIIDEVRSGIQYLFQTQSKLVLAMSGSGHSGLETVISNLVAPNETLLIATRGIWDERAYSMATRYNVNPIAIRISTNETFRLDQLEPALRKYRPKAMFVTHGDTSIGNVQNLVGLGKLCHKYDTLLLVDTVVTIGGQPFFMDEWEVDAVYTSTQKALSGPAGITPVAFSAKAEAKINNRKHEPPFYFDIKLLALQWNCYGITRAYHHTISPPLLWALRHCMREMIEESLPAAWERHAATNAHFHQRLNQLSLQLFVPKPEDRLITVTTVVLPKGYDYFEFVKYMKTKHNIMIYVGLGPTSGKALRIGLMGVNATIRTADAVANAMEDTLRALKKSSL